MNMCFNCKHWHPNSQLHEIEVDDGNGLHDLSVTWGCNSAIANSLVGEQLTTKGTFGCIYHELTEKPETLDERFDKNRDEYKKLLKERRENNRKKREGV